MQKVNCLRKRAKSIFLGKVCKEYILWEKKQRVYSLEKYAKSIFFRIIILSLTRVFLRKKCSKSTLFLKISKNVHSLGKVFQDNFLFKECKEYILWEKKAKSRFLRNNWKWILWDKYAKSVFFWKSLKRVNYSN